MRANAYRSNTPTGGRPPSLARWVWASVLVVLASMAFTAVSAALPVTPQVVGGGEAHISELPFQVALYDPAVDPNPANSQFCGGVILDSRHVITAAHCVFDEAAGQAGEPSQFEVLAGSANLDTSELAPSEYVEDPVSSTSFDPQWNPQTGEHDLGLLTLTNPLWNGQVPERNGLSTIAPVPLLSPAEAEKYAQAGMQATVSGWGDTYPEPLQNARPSYPRLLHSVSIPLVSNELCTEQNELQEPLGPEFVCAGETGKDACYGDSGGPLVVPTGLVLPADYALLGTVDLGFGCAQENHPGLFQSVVDSENANFLRSNPPQAPLGWTRPTITGTASPGQTLTCDPGAWAGGSPLALEYQFYIDESSISQAAARALNGELSLSPSYSLPSSLAPSARVFCVVAAINRGGWAQAISPDVTVTGAVAQSTPAAVAPATVVDPPTLKVISASCKKTGSCTVNVLASAETGAGAVTKVNATLTSKQTYTCKRRRKKTKCTRTVAHKTQIKSMPASHFLILASALKAGPYVLSLSAVDEAGLSQSKPTKVALLVPAAKKH